MMKTSTIAAVCVLAGTAAAQSGGLIPREFTVILRERETIRDIAESYGALVVGSYEPRRLYLLRVVQTGDDEALEHELEGDDRLDSSEQNRENAIAGGHTQSFFVSSAPSDFMNQPAWRTIRMPENTSSWLGQGVSIAVLDTGVYPHIAFGGSVRADGTSFVDSVPAMRDDRQGLDTNGNGRPDELAGHGTFMAGLITHIAPKCSILPIRVLDSDGVGSTFSVAAGMYYAIDHGARIINLSLNSPVDSPTMREAVAAALNADVVVVCAAGNESNDVPMYPAANPGVVAVASTDSQDQLAPWSSFGPFVGFSAPGVGVVSTLPPNAFGAANGTSASAALVSGCIAKMASRWPGEAGPNLVSNLWSGSRDIGPINPAFAGQIGRGLSLPPELPMPPRKTRSR